MVRQIERRLREKPLLPYTYMDFGSLVALGRYSTVGNLMGFLIGRNIFIEGFFARLPLAASDARTGAAWDSSHSAGLAGTPFVACYWPASKAALMS
jgi:NADH dehydrogenase FAD-containing subunit